MDSGSVDKFNLPDFYQQQRDLGDKLQKLQKKELKITDLTNAKEAYQESIKQAKKINFIALSLPTLIALYALSDKISILNAKIKTFEEAEKNEKKPNVLVRLFRRFFPPAQFKPVENLNPQKLLELHQQISKKRLIEYLDKQNDLADSWHNESEFEFEPQTEEDLEQAIKEIYSEKPYRKIADIFYITSNSKDPTGITKISFCSWGKNEDDPSVRTYVLQNDGIFLREKDKERLTIDELIAEIDVRKQKVVPIGEFVKFYEACLSFAKDDQKWSRSVFETREEAIASFKKIEKKDNCAALYITRDGLNVIGWEKGAKAPKDIAQFTFDPKIHKLIRDLNSYSSVYDAMRPQGYLRIFSTSWTPVTQRFDEENAIGVGPTRTRAQAIIQEETRGRAQAILPEAVQERPRAPATVEPGLQRERTQAILPEELSPFIRVKKAWEPYSPAYSIWPRDPANKLLARGIESLQLFKDNVNSLSAADAKAILDYIFEDSSKILPFILTKFFSKTYSAKIIKKNENISKKIKKDVETFQKSDDSREKCKILIEYMKGYLDAINEPEKRNERPTSLINHLKIAVESAPSLFPKGFVVPNGRELIDALSTLLAKASQ